MAFDATKNFLLINMKAGYFYVFIHLDVETNCARTEAVFVPRAGSKSHVKGEFHTVNSNSSVGSILLI